jgi:signal transduction histidine kinase
MVWNWLRRHPRLVDTALVLLLAAISFARTAHSGHWLAGLPLTVFEVAPLLVRRRYPLAVLAIVGAATVVEEVLYASAIPLGAGVAVYTAAAQLPRRVSLVASAVVTGAVGIVELIRTANHSPLGDVFFLGLAWVIGDNLGTRRAYLKELELRADRLEREQAAEAARAVAEEQARIARELHDVIAHNVSVMVVQAAAGRDAFDTRPARAREALEAIESSGRAALDELRRLLGAIRDDDPDFRPQPRLSDLSQLVDGVRASGLGVSLHIEGTAQELPVAVELSAYRVVQEALTNTLKHADATHADVWLRYDRDALSIAVRDDGRAAPTNGAGGSGLIGMRERAAAFGGTVSAGPAAGGGYVVEARLPL